MPILDLPAPMIANKQHQNRFKLYFTSTEIKMQLLIGKSSKFDIGYLLPKLIILDIITFSKLGWIRHAAAVAFQKP